MPVKRRTAKRRKDPAAELRAWAEVFECYYDFFHDLEDWGIAHPVGGCPPSERLAAEAKFMEAARDAWQRLGGMFMETWKPTAAIETPWALEQFGAPPCR